MTEIVFDYNYESLGANSTMGQNAVAGALAGIGEHCLMYPLDSIKTRIQADHERIQKSHSANWYESQKQLWRGVYSVIMGAGPAHALHFATYEYCKEHFYELLKSKPYIDDSLKQVIATSSAGALATLAHDSLLTPFDVIKQRMQLNGSTYRSVRECARKVYATEGLQAFYISLPTTLSMSIPFQSIQFTTYEWSLSILNPQGNYNPKSHVIAGAIAGMVASSLTVKI
ncbi:unnamed protein product [Cunninghamella echinulata]